MSLKDSSVGEGEHSRERQRFDICGNGRQQIDGETVETVSDFIFLGSKITAAMKLKEAPWKKNYDKLSVLKSQRHHFANKGPYGQRYDFSNSHACL